MNKNDYTFESAMARLDELSGMLSSPEVTLQGSVALFREAADLVKLCGELLKNTELELRTITEELENEDE